MRGRLVGVSEWARGLTVVIQATAGVAGVDAVLAEERRCEVVEGEGDGSEEVVGVGAGMYLAGERGWNSVIALTLCEHAYIHTYIYVCVCIFPSWLPVSRKDSSTHPIPPLPNHTRIHNHYPTSIHTQPNNETMPKFPNPTPIQ